MVQNESRNTGTGTRSGDAGDSGRVRIGRIGRGTAVAVGSFVVCAGLVAPTAAQSAPSVGTNVAPAAKFKENGKFKVRATTFGMHATDVQPGTVNGSNRLNGAPLWRTIQPTKNTWRWDIFDQKVAQSKQWGFRSIQVSFFGTPAWAATGAVKNPKAVINGHRSTAAPKISAYKRFVTKVVKRYKTDVDVYQAWNEVTSNQFYQGSPKQMAKMTKVLNRVVNRWDPSAKVSAASVQTHRQRTFDRFVPEYFKQLRKRNWPVDILAGHFYPSGKGPKARVAQINMFHRAAKRARAPKRLERWDTEVNFGLQAPGAPGGPDGRIKGNRAATYVARTYLDSWREGLSRTYWYHWTRAYDGFTGIQFHNMRQTGPRAYNNLAGWTIGSTFKGCKNQRNISVCSFKKGGKNFKIVWANKGKKTYRYPGKKNVCPVKTGKCQRKSKAVVKAMPTLVK